VVVYIGSNSIARTDCERGKPRFDSRTSHCHTDRSM